MPGDAEQVARVDVPESDTFQFLFNFGRNLRGVFHLRVSGDDDIALAGALHGSGAAGFVNGEINFAHGGFS